MSAANTLYASSASVLIEVGNTEPLQHHRYLRVGEQLHLVRDIYPQQLFATPDYYLAEPREQ